MVDPEDFRAAAAADARLAHGVGSGKTTTQIIASYEAKRLGLSAKPMIVVQKSTVTQFAAEYRKVYPDARLLVASAKTFSVKNRQRFMSKIATGSYDAVIMTQPQFDRLADDPRSIVEYFNEQLDGLEEMLLAAKEHAGVNRRDVTVKQLEKAKIRLQNRLQKALEGLQDRQDNALYFQDLGVDMLFIDEAHAYKRVPIVTQMVRVKGVPRENSQRAVGLQIKAKFIQDRNAGRGVVLATGTPITNTMAEVYAMLKLAAPNVLREYNIGNFDDFAHTFGDTQSDVEYTWAQTYKRVTRFKKFVNGPELITLIRSGFDVAMGNEKLGLKVPRIKGGAPEAVIVAQTPAMQANSRWIQRITPTWKNASAETARAW